MNQTKLPRKPIDDVRISDIDSFLDSEGKALRRDLVFLPYSEVMEQIEHYRSFHDRAELEEKMKKEGNYFRRLVRTQKFIEGKYKKNQS